MCVNIKTESFGEDFLVAAKFAKIASKICSTISALPTALIIALKKLNVILKSKNYAVAKPL